LTSSFYVLFWFTFLNYKWTFALFLKFELEMNLTFITRMLLHASDDLHTYLHSIIEKHEEIGKFKIFWYKFFSKTGRR